ncbi:calcium-transporting ATPase 1, plasma membrane-type [Coffea arabica]|uniref:Calcium-transporting ATPase 1, plasma membrane-type-like n=1 Tax=Coffea arabica TaxID=13443 RepID=A0A6P6SU78_COFAR|nr:calcium-transporting ATPase 1, plasma membrane-type-like [Coffea arabica]XP_027069346.1 calcium-transporting ATPase 1, plasma membrane-type-like [Coffea arabica]
MEKLLKEFNVPAKHGSEEELSLWRKLVMPVKNPRRRFRYVANLDKRSAVLEQKAKIGEKLQACLVLYMEELESTDAGDDFMNGYRGRRNAPRR